jgi:hypothetical protein
MSLNGLNSPTVLPIISLRENPNNLKRNGIHIVDAPCVNVQNQDAVFRRLKQSAITQFRGTERLLGLRYVAAYFLDLLIGLHFIDRWSLHVGDDLAKFAPFKHAAGAAFPRKFCCRHPCAGLFLP